MRLSSISSIGFRNRYNQNTIRKEKQSNYKTTSQTFGKSNNNNYLDKNGLPRIENDYFRIPTKMPSATKYYMSEQDYRELIDETQTLIYFIEKTLEEYDKDSMGCNKKSFGYNDVTQTLGYAPWKHIYPNLSEREIVETVLNKKLEIARNRAAELIKMFEELYYPYPI